MAGITRGREHELADLTAGPEDRALPLTQPEWADHFTGIIGIEWPAAGPGLPGKALPGWRVTPYDGDGPVLTVQRLTIHASADGLVWAELAMFADRDGNPILHGKPVILEDGIQVLTGTFRFLVTSMRVRES